MSPASLSEASSGVHVAFTFALLGFCISSSFGLPCRVFYIFSLFWIYICFQQYFFAAVCSRGQ